jgi:membrane associated rhomboid family serine protease
MMTLSVFGPVVETQMGRRHFLGIYFGAGITAGLFYLGEVFLRIQTGFATFETLHMPLVGASGAVLGLAVAFAFLFPSARLFVFPLPFPVKARTAMIGFVILSVILIFFTVAKGIAHSAHLGGMAFGTGYMLWLRRRVRCSRQGGERGVLESDPSGWDMPTLRRELEPILTKISSHGLAGLSERERTVLREAQRRFG